MSTNENTPVPDDALSADAVELQRSTLVGPQSRGWLSAQEYMQPIEAVPAKTPFYVYMHGLRRHWVLAIALGAVCAVTFGLAVWYGWGAQYKAAAYLQVAPWQESIAFETAETRNQRFSPDAFDLYKQTQAQRVKQRNVLEAALRKPEVAELKLDDRYPDPVVWLQDELWVNFPQKAQLMEVSLTGRDGPEMTKLVNAIVSAYMEEVVDKDSNERNAKLTQLDAAFEAKTREMRNYRSNLKQIADQLGAPDTESASLKQQIVLQEYADFRRELIRAQFQTRESNSEMLAQQALLDAVDTMQIADAEVKAYARNDPTIRELAREYSFRAMDDAYTAQVVRPGVGGQHAQRYAQDLQAVRMQMDGLTAQMREEIREQKRAEFKMAVDTLRVKVSVFSAAEQALKKDVEVKRQEAQRVTGGSIDLEMERNKIENLGVVLGGIAEEREKLKVELESASRIELVQSAEPPRVPVNTAARYALTLLAMLVGFCLPAGVIMWFDARGSRVNMSSEISSNLGLPVLGSVPVIPARVMRHLGSPAKRNQTWRARLTESVDSIAARLLRKAELKGERTVLVSSASAGEGKTSLAMQLALSLARSGRRTVLVDFDLRRPAFDGVFGLSREPGVSEVLRGEHQITDVVQPTGSSDLSVVTAGRWNRHALTALANGAAEAILTQLREQFEFVILDSSPILPVADTRFLSQHVDTVILSVFRDISRTPKIAAACEILEAFGVETIEAVVAGTSESLRDKDLSYQASLTA